MSRPLPLDERLVTACRRGRPDMAAQRLAAGCDPNARGDYGCSALLKTCLSSEWTAGHTEVVRLLLEAGADTEARYESTGASPLLAVAGGFAGDTERAACVRLLLGHGASASASDYQFETSLHKAARLGHAAVVESLLAHGAPIDPVATGNVTPFCLAVEQRVTGPWKERGLAMARALLRAGASPDGPPGVSPRPWLRLAESGDVALLGLMQQHGTDIRCRDASGHHALWLAPDPSTLLALLEMGLPLPPEGRPRRNFLAWHAAHHPSTLPRTTCEALCHARATASALAPSRGLVQRSRRRG